MIVNYTEERNETYILVSGQHGKAFKITEKGKLKYWFGGFIRLRTAFITLVSALVSKFSNIENNVDSCERQIKDLFNTIRRHDEEIAYLWRKLESKKKNARNSR